jgi:hypothetical protein
MSPSGRIQGRNGDQVAQGQPPVAPRRTRTSAGANRAATASAGRRARVRTTRRSLGGQKVVLPGVHHILKGGEDSIGALEAIQRVYFNIGSCSEQCWVNHFADMRQVDPEQRGFGQTPFDIGQCRRDCPNFRAVEDRLQNMLDFFASAESDQTDLARRPGQGPPGGESGREPTPRRPRLRSGTGVRQRCCHARAKRCSPRTARAAIRASRKAKAGRSGTATSPLPSAHPRQVRADFLGNDQPTPVTEVGTFRCRALHSNHKAGHLYMEYGFRHAAQAAGGRRHSRA